MPSIVNPVAVQMARQRHPKKEILIAARTERNSGTSADRQDDSGLSAVPSASADSSPSNRAKVSIGISDMPFEYATGPHMDCHFILLTTILPYESEAQMNT